MKLKNKIILCLSTFIMSIFFTEKTLIITEFIKPSLYTRWFEYGSFLMFIPFFYFIVKEYLFKHQEVIDIIKYSKKLNQVLISQSHNPLFYQGNIKEGGKILTKEVTNTLDTDRCSIWLFNEDKTSIICQLLYIKSKDSYTSGLELLESDFRPYFEHLKSDPIIIADEAENHPATKCFTEDYLKPIGIKSMLDVPIIFKGEVIGVICIENKTPRKWNLVEVNFTQLLSSLYSFAYSTKEINKLSNDILEFDNFVDVSCLVSKTDLKGRITYVNQKFENVSGYKSEELIGKDHRIVNSGEHTKDFWREMYKTTIYDKGIWNSIVVNKTKKGELYWVDSYIKADFDENGKLEGFMSIRFDITELIKKNIEIENKNTYLEHASKIIRHDMHSGINTYIPRGISSLERRLKPEDIERLKIDSPLKMIKEGLKHTQKVYKGVYEFTNLVKKNTVLNREKFDLKKILESYLESTSYKSQVLIDELGEFKVNEPLFCTAVDNLIRNGLKYNDSETKFVKIYKEKEVQNKKTIGVYMIIQDNGRGLTQSEFNRLSKPYARKRGQKEKGTGLGLNICIAILKEHGFEITCEKNNTGTKMKIKLK